jgi:hypothetical protein
VITIPPLAERDGQLYRNGLAEYVGGHLLVPSEAHTPAAIPALSGQAPGRINLYVESSSNSDEQIISSQASSIDGRAYCLLQAILSDESHCQRPWCNHPVPAAFLFGTAQNPFIFDPLYSITPLLRARQHIVMDFVNGGALIPSWIPSFQATQVKGPAVLLSQDLASQITTEAIDGQRLVPYWLAPEDNPDGLPWLSGLTVPANNYSTARFFNRLVSARVVLTTIFARAYQHASSRCGDPDVFLELLTPTDRQNLQNVPIALSNRAYDAAFPRRLPTPLSFRANDQFEVRVTNTGSVAVDVFVAFHGVQVNE